MFRNVICLLCFMCGDYNAIQDMVVFSTLDLKSADSPGPSVLQTIYCGGQGGGEFHFDPGTMGTDFVCMVICIISSCKLDFFEYVMLKAAHWEGFAALTSFVQGSIRVRYFSVCHILCIFVMYFENILL